MSASIFAQALGEAAVAALPAPVKALHDGDGPPIWHGRAEIETGASPVARLLGRIIGLPPAGRDVALTVSIDRDAGPDGQAEIWTRDFGGVCFSSRLAIDTAGTLQETFGPIAFSLGLAVRDDGLALPVTDAHCLGLPLPRLLLPRSESREYADAEGRFRFDIKLTLPLFGLLTHYRGWLVPAGEALTPPEQDERP